jgi:hypothetical protein
VKTTRRRVLAYGVGGAALLTAGGALRWFAFGYAKDAGVALSPKEYAVVRAIVEALFPAHGAFPSAIALGVHAKLDEEVYSQREDIAADLKAGIQLLEHAPPLVGSFGRLSALPVDERGRVLRALMERGPQLVVQVAVALQQMASLFYWGHPSTWGAIGYDGPWQKDPRPPPSTARYQAAVDALKERA